VVAPGGAAGTAPGAPAATAPGSRRHRARCAPDWRAAVNFEIKIGGKIRKLHQQGRSKVVAALSDKIDL